MPQIPHKLYVNGHLLGLMQTDHIQIEIPSGAFEIKVQSLIPILSSTLVVNIEEGVRNVMTFSDREKFWDALFWGALLMEIVHLFLNLSRGWNLAYHIVDDGLFLAWLIYEWSIRKRYFQLHYSHYKTVQT